MSVDETIEMLQRRSDEGHGDTECKVPCQTGGYMSVNEAIYVYDGEVIEGVLIDG